MNPSGDSTPSQADVEMTRQVAQVARTFGIQELDHVIVGKDDHASLKGLTCFSRRASAISD